jgi:hypothetical protein
MQKSDTLFKERMNDEWTKNKGYVADIMSTINVGHGEDMTGDLIPLKWLNMWAESPRLEENLDTSSLLCPHKKLAFNKVFMTRLVSIKAVIVKLNREKNQLYVFVFQAEHFYETFEGGPRLTVPECLCQDCILTQCKLLQLKEAIEKDSKTILQDMKQTKKGE